ncbi:aspartate/glutamate racemase family protein [Pseudoruegeria sp. SK021]|uniref:aspartate racemase/maleate isomerase family protein n=1 Tax=Pseudoruegeria sp. SK021 TaxID=1933035 RepID=UPI000A216D97|nr:aspartate/glutamate racemase family protein [Pseudoruegeria sp. SK021]OSP56422.1 hypothetical protein BV911_00165 [Pseudoruegeria sp. SK021]
MPQTCDVLLSTTPPAYIDRSAVTRLGLIALATDLTTERDAAHLIPQDRAALHVARVAFENPTTPDNLRRMLPRLTDAANLLIPDEPLAAIYYACTSASIAIGDTTVSEAVGAARPGVPVVTPTSGALAAMAALGVGPIALFTPYLPETTEPMVGFFDQNGHRVMRAHCLGLEDDRDMARLTPETIIDAALAADHPDAEALFLSCTAMPALGVIDALEAQLGKPVLSSNLAGLWQVLRVSGLAPSGTAPGRLFRHHRTEAL